MCSRIRKVLLIFLILLTCSSLSAKDNYDISFFFGTGTKEWMENGVSFMYGMNFGLSEHIEFSLGGHSSLVPFFTKNMIYGEFSYALLGPRSTGSKVAGNGINMLLSLGGYYDFYDSGAGVYLSWTPLTVGNPMTGKRDRIFKINAGYDIVHNKAFVFFSFFLYDIYVRGTWRDYY